MSAIPVKAKTPFAAGFGHARDWFGAAAVAVALNLALFGLMPGLIVKAPSRIVADSPLQQIRVMHLKRPMPPQSQAKQAKQAKREKPHASQPLPQPPRIALPAPPSSASLPLALAPKLSVRPGDTPLPPMAGISLPVAVPGSVFDLAELDQAPVPLVRLPPVYPLGARRRGIEGSVKVSFRVSAAGEVDNIRIETADPPEIFEASVIRCVSGWRFKPGIVAGEPVNTRVETIIRFELK